MPKFGSRSFLRSPTIVTLINAVTLNNLVTAYNSAAVDVSAFRRFLLYLNIDSTLAPTDVQFIVQFSDDGGTTWYSHLQDLFASLFYEDVDTGSGLLVCFAGDVEGRTMRLRMVGTGTSATALFTVTAKAEFYAD